MSKPGRETEDGQLPLPSPSSPRELDERILAHARENAPDHKGHAAGWLGGLATAAALVLAVYLTNLADQGALAPGPAAPELAAPELAAPELAAPEQEQVRAARTAPASLESEAKLKVSADADTPAPARAELQELPAAPAAEARFDSAGLAADQAAIVPDLQASLARLENLLAEGETELARREYAALRESCTECDLPDTLEEALEQVHPPE